MKLTAEQERLLDATPCTPAEVLRDMLASLSYMLTIRYRGTWRAEIIDSTRPSIDNTLDCLTEQDQAAWGSAFLQRQLGRASEHGR